MAEYKVATKAALGAKAMAGKSASPSLATAFAAKALNGTIPCK